MATKGQGHSFITEQKERDFKKFLESLWFKWVKNALRRSYYKREIIYIDAYAGCGKNPTCDGSPIIFCSLAKKFGIKYQAHLIELEKDLSEQLCYNMSEYNAVVHHGNNREKLPEILSTIPRNSLGILYVDPNGIPDWQMIIDASRQLQLKRIDILIRYNTNALWRNLHHNGYLDLSEYLKAINKEYRYGKEYMPYDKWRWSFLLLMNYRFGDWKKEGWKDFKTKDGKELLTRLIYSPKQLQKKSQLSLFPTELMQNI